MSHATEQASKSERGIDRVGSGGLVSRALPPGCKRVGYDNEKDARHAAQAIVARQLFARKPRGVSTYVCCWCGQIHIRLG